MIFTNNFKKISLVDNGIVLTYKSKNTKEILFSELDKTHIKTNKIKPAYGLIIILLSLCFEMLSYMYLQINIILLITFFLIVLIILKMNDYKSYSIKIRLKNGEIIEEKIQTKLKLETIDIVNDVQKAIYNYKIKNSK
ncbi:hypothetical protein ACNQGP_09225 [Flavobacterium sp. GT2N3]|uniref:hypothetical protein n=1 Tax=unclassified Flavobacterium TaxID=196869 RepID=UPI003AAB3AB6